MDEKPKPCPFCGGAASIWECEPRLHRYPNYHYCVVCFGCDLYFGYDMDYGGEFDTEEEAIKEWNRRAT